MLRARPAPLGLLATVATLGLGCSEADLGPRATGRGAPDKAELFGDPTLVPTRDGEAARRELAAAGELDAVLRASGWLDPLHVDVELGDRRRVIVGGRRTELAPAAIDDAVHELARGVLGDEPELVLAIADAKHSAPPGRARELPLLLAALGFGACVALVLDRSLRRRRSPRRRATPPPAKATARE